MLAAFGPPPAAAWAKWIVRVISTPAREPLQRALDQPLRFRVHAARRFVEDEHGGVARSKRVPAPKQISEHDRSPAKPHQSCKDLLNGCNAPLVNPCQLTPDTERRRPT